MIDTNAKGSEWWRRSVIYQIYPRSFMDSSGDGVGDLAGITSRLDYLSWLGIDAIWISPFQPSPMADFGYDVSDYVGVDPMFGTLEDFDDLLDGAHSLGIRVIIDWVPNHSSDQHEWFRESRSSLGSSKRDWYVWQDGRQDGSPPNNWLSVFGGSAWTFDEETGQWYLHSFLKEQPDLNWRNQEVQHAMLDTLRFWLDRGVDGFRIDVAQFVMKDPDMRDNPPADPSQPPFKVMGPYSQQQHVHDQGHPDVHGVFRSIRHVLDSYEGDRFAVGEIHEMDWTKWASYYGEGDELHMPFNFSLLYMPWDAEVCRDLINGMEGALSESAWPNLVLGNHDEARLATRYGPERARVAAMLMLTARGTPTMYYGDEIGMEEAEIPPESVRDPWGIRVPGMSRDGCRTPMQWNGAAKAGFSVGESATWLPIGPDAGMRHVDEQRADSGSLLSYYRTLLALRRSEPALHLGDYVAFGDHPEVFAFIRSHEGTRFLVALNFSDSEHDIGLPGAGTIEVATKVGSQDEVSESLKLAANEGVVVRLI